MDKMQENNHLKPLESKQKQAETGGDITLSGREPYQRRPYLTGFSPKHKLQSILGNENRTQPASGILLSWGIRGQSSGLFQQLEIEGENSRKEEVTEKETLNSNPWLTWTA